MHQSSSHTCSNQVIQVFFFFLKDTLVKSVLSSLLDSGIVVKSRMEYFQLEGTFSDHLVQLPDHFRADQKFKHVS